jgi:heme exporter protein A
MAVFTGTGLACTRGERTVFQGLSFTLSGGALIELRGANGSGKSSLLRMMAGLLPPAGGALAWNGTPIGEDRDSHRARVAYVGHLDAVKGALTVAENLAFWAKLRGGSDADVTQALTAFRITDLARVPARHLSAGQRRRVALARLLACPAPLWLLDEPATALDTQAQAALDHAMAAHLGAGGMVVMATHEPGQRPTPRLDLDDHARTMRAQSGTAVGAQR